MSWLLFAQIVVLFLMMGMGVIIVKTGLLKASDSRILSTVCLYLVVPCMQIQAFQVTYSETVRAGFMLALLAAVIINAIQFSFVYLLQRPLGFTDEERDSLLYSNAGNFIVPLVAAVLGEDHVIYASAFILIQGMLLWSHGRATLERSGRIDFKKILLDVNILSIFIGAILFFAKITLDGVVADTIHGVARMIGPISMFSIGMVLAGVHWREVFANKRIYLIVLLKMVVMPGIILLVLKFSALKTLIPGGESLLLISLLAVLAPSGSSIPQMALIYHRDADYASAINALTTVVCVVTMPLMAWLYQI